MIVIVQPSAHVGPTLGQDRFEQLLPAIRRSAQFAFRKLPPAERDEAIGEVVAISFRDFRRLVDLGKMDLAYAGPLARFAIAQFRSGRLVGASLSQRDVLDSPCRGRGRRFVASLSSRDAAGDWHETLVDARRWPVADQAAFRVDFPAWLQSLDRRDRELATFLSLGHRVREAAERFGLSAARISQLRSQWQSAWEAFHALPGEDHCGSSPQRRS